MKTDLQSLQKPENDPYSEDFFSERMTCTHRSFLREILKIASTPEIISFAGGIPNPDYFPLEEIKKAALKVLTDDGRSALQYSVTEGYYPLREYISKKYKATKGLDISPEEILITNGSQQGLDLIGKIFLNKGENVLLEKPSYLGAIQALSAYQPEFFNADLLEDGIDIDQAETILWENRIKLFYTVPDFQNPTGITYSLEKRKALSEILGYHDTLIVEDSPYGEIYFDEEQLPSFKNLLPKQTILLGSFSKIVSPGLRLGWVACRKAFMDKLVIAKQAADLHSNILSQKIMYTFLTENNLDEHLSKIRKGYRHQRDLMLSLIENNFPKEIRYTKPAGGLFIWLTLPEYCNAFDILNKAIEEGVAFVPGSTFYQDGKGKNTIRLSYSNYNEEQMQTGILRLTNVLKQYIKS